MTPIDTAVQSPSFDPATIALTAAITASVTVAVQEPLKRLVGFLWRLAFSRHGNEDLEERVLEWRRKGDELQAEVALQQARIDRQKQLLHGPPESTVSSEEKP